MFFPVNLYFNQSDYDFSEAGIVQIVFLWTVFPFTMEALFMKRIE